MPVTPMPMRARVTDSIACAMVAVASAASSAWQVRTRRRRLSTFCLVVVTWRSMMELSSRRKGLPMSSPSTMGSVISETKRSRSTTWQTILSCTLIPGSIWFHIARHRSKVWCWVSSRAVWKLMSSNSMARDHTPSSTSTRPSSKSFS